MRPAAQGWGLGSWVWERGKGKQTQIKAKQRDAAPNYKKQTRINTDVEKAEGRMKKAENSGAGMGDGVQDIGNKRTGARWNASLPKVTN
jgi:hypothetical protein